MGTTVRRSALELFFSAVSSDKVRKPFFCNWLRRWRVRFIQIRIKTVYFKSKEHMDYDLAVKVSSTLGVLIVLDTFVMCLVIAVSGSAPVYWSLRL